MTERSFNDDDYIRRARAIHGDRYDYSRISFRGAKSRITVVCPVHGPWEPLANSHLQGHGCRKCSTEKRSISFDQFVELAKRRHAGRYNYSREDYAGWTVPMNMFCPQHGTFQQRPKEHVSKNRCPKCAGKIAIDTESFIAKAIEIHGLIYDYSAVRFTTSSQKVEIICKTHGKFWQTPNAHLRGTKCPTCAGKRVTNTESFIIEAEKIHGPRYDYSASQYVLSNRKLTIICPTHGAFNQTANSHLHGNGCPTCGGKRYHNGPSFIAEAMKVHGSQYDYSSLVYRGSQSKLEIICPVHGRFEQAADHHLRPQGCPSCGVSLSRGETELTEFIESLGEKVMKRRRDIIPPLELDIYLPERKLAIEFCGTFWHSEAGGKDKNYHRNKFDVCRTRGIELITIYDDEWNERRETVEAILRTRLNRAPRGVGARSVEVCFIDSKSAGSFLARHHLRGPARGKTESLGAFASGVLIAVMTFAKSRNNTENELVRFCSDGKIYPGIASKLFRVYVRSGRASRIISFSDHRWYSGRLYEKLGFVSDGELKPDYEYLHKNRRYHKSTFRKTKMQKRFGGTGTERSMAIEQKIYRIYDCGKTRWVWNGGI